MNKLSSWQYGKIFSSSLLVKDIMIFFHGNSMKVPIAQGKQGNGKQKSLSGKTQSIWQFCQNTGNFAKTQGQNKEFCVLKDRQPWFEADLVKRICLRHCYWDLNKIYDTPNESLHFFNQLI